MMNSKNTRDISINLNSNQIKDQVASLLYAYGIVKDNEEIVEIDFGNIGKELTLTNIKIRKNSEVKTIDHHG